MVKFGSSHILALFGLILIGVIALYLVKFYSLRFRPNIATIHVINLDKDITRWEHMKETTEGLIPRIERWEGVNGKKLTPDEMGAKGVGFAMTISGKGVYSEREKDLRNQGVVGCFLSHQSLIKHLGTLDVPDYYGHLILEDDVTIPKNFLKAGDEFSKIQAHVPLDWDILYLDVTEPYGYSIGNNIMKLQYKQGLNSGNGNWGTHAYIVRHGAIKEKVEPWLEHMVDSIDQHYKRQFNKWKVYAVVPGIIPLDPVLSSPENSSIQEAKKE